MSASLNISHPVLRADIDTLEFSRTDGLLPAVVQHAGSGAVLMVGYMNRAALLETLSGGQVVFYSRSRQRLWKKGESSGNLLDVCEIHTDCDRDALLVTAHPRGPVCHAGTATCFGEGVLTSAQRLAFLAALEALIARRAEENSPDSYTARLLAQGQRRIAQKVGEEGLEVALAGACEADGQLVAEAADLLFHLLVLFRSRGSSLEGVVAELERRHAAAGGLRGDVR